MRGRLRTLTTPLAAAAITALLAALAAGTPIEAFVTMAAYGERYVEAYPWLPYWRVAVAMFYLWLVASAFASRKRMLLTWLMVTSTTAFALAHYLHLYIVVLARGVRVELLPLLYRERYAEGVTLHLDLGQVAIAATAAELYLILRRPPRTASSGRRTPSR